MEGPNPPFLAPPASDPSSSFAAAQESAPSGLAAAGDAPPSPIGECDFYRELISELSPCVVTVSSVAESTAATFTTGFTLLSQERYTVIFSSNMELPKENSTAITEYSIYFQDKVKLPAGVLYEGEQFIILIVKDAMKLLNSSIITIGALGGTKLHPNTPVVHALIGVLGGYRGSVTTPNCRAVDANRNDVEGSDKFFVVTCPMQDKIILLDTVDKKTHSAKQIMSAPVFRLTTGEVIGIIYSSGDWMDFKSGLHVKEVLSFIEGILVSEVEDSWEERLKVMADAWWERRGDSVC